MPQSNSMSDLQNKGRDAAEASKGVIADAASRVKEKASELGQSAREALHESRVSTADALSGASKGLHSGADAVGRAGHSATDAVHSFGHDAADTVGATAQYVRTHGAKDIMSDVESMVKKNPAVTLLAAATVGFLVGRSLRSE